MSKRRPSRDEAAAARGRVAPGQPANLAKADPDAHGGAAPTSYLLADEPSSGIAQREAEALGPLLRRVRDETGASLMLIEHDIPLLLSTVDRLLALDLGEVVAVGDPDAVIHDPHVVASYLGTDSVSIGRSGDG